MTDKSIRDKHRRDATKDFITNIKKSVKCWICGLSDSRCIEFHHWYPPAKSFGINEAIRLRLNPATIQKEIDKCIPVCANCHDIIEIECVL